MIVAAEQYDTLSSEAQPPGSGMNDVWTAKEVSDEEI